MKRSVTAIAAIALTVGGFGISRSHAADGSASGVQEVLNQSAQQMKYTLIVFSTQDDAATQSMAQTVKDGVAKRSDWATLTFVQMNNPAEKAVVERFNVGRAPAPLTLAVAPNGAVTGVFVKTISDDRIASAFVTRTKADCMKSLQQGKLVLVCVNPVQPAAFPQAVQDFQTDPQFKDRIAVVSMQANDPKEAPFVSEMQLTAAEASNSTTVFLAPPGVLVGKFDASATQERMAAALHKAGQCCDDPKCKHNSKSR